jgi:hypothetical protein
MTRVFTAFLLTSDFLLNLFQSPTRFLPNKKATPCGAALHFYAAEKLCTSLHVEVDDEIVVDDFVSEVSKELA